MPNLTEPQAAELTAAAHAAADVVGAVPAHRRAVPVVCRMAAVDPVAGRRENTASLLELVRGDEEGMRAAIEVAGRILAGSTRPDGQVVPVGGAAGDPMMKTACDVVQLTVKGETELVWEQLKDQHPARRAAVLSLLVAWLNYHFAGLDPVSLAADEYASRTAD